MTASQAYSGDPAQSCPIVVSTTIGTISPTNSCTAAVICRMSQAAVCSASAAGASATTSSWITAKSRAAGASARWRYRRANARFRPSAPLPCTGELSATGKCCTVSGQTATLLTDTIEIRAEGIPREVVLPQAGREELDLKGGVGIDPLEDIDEIDVGIEALYATGGQQTLNDADMARAHFRPAEEPVAPAQGNDANLPFQMIGINGHVGVDEKHFERRFPLQGCVFWVEMITDSGAT